MSWNGVRLRTINLASAKVTHRVFSVASFAAGRVGTVRIEVTSRNRSVVIDGLLLSRT